ncbi:aminodeoxychorismate synthase component I [Streptomyces sp. LX-29]|uniref:aminodeoxychorismate synthase component I n=1 Tax=Streptomyces sp. LX-29 TaxID=2900152 RepID=UPI00240E13C7|nr:aminodeoxychorismate synthase component I [Streptomyces sp. LX-29]WFB11953.1 aminodeoxychorismate synthase component I [Streptomyces sp. LX-29]
MRTLLIDNYDSFTYNLFHYLAEVNEEEPVVIRHDDPLPSAAALRGFDNVVISPGPGRPERAADFGICQAVISASALPLLGVCLGHQGLCHVFGGTVDRAPEVRHGRVSPVVHDGSGLFAGLPSPFEAVRYHSLAVDGLPAELTAAAWTPDGVLMGVAHRDKPLWGVQFHPESIGTAHGHQLIRNFRELTRAWWRRNGEADPAARRGAPHARKPVPAAAEGHRRPAAAGARRFRVLVERMATRVADEAVFERLFSGSRHAFWLDSSRPDGESGRFSLMGDAGGPLARVATADVWEQTVTVESAAGTEVVHGPFLEWLDADLAARHVRVPDLPFDFALGWVGYLGYELKAECGGERAHRSTEPDAAMIFADRAVVFDHLTSTTYLLALAEHGRAAPARDWLAETRAELARLADRPTAPAAEPAQPAASTAVHTDPATVGELRLRHDRARYLELIAACQEAIGQGETYEVCLTNMVTAPGRLDPWLGYRYLRRVSPAPFAALLRLDGLSVLSTSPERFLRVSAAGEAESKPIKGTRPRGASPYEDALLRADLLGNEKDRAENLMIVDLVRNDLGRCAEVGSVHVPRLFEVESYATVHQLVSTVRATLRPDSSAVACVRAAFPGGSMTGAPKIRTMHLIDELEAGPRGVYSGALGYFSLSGAADLSMVIRTVVATPDRVGYGVGGAIVALSDPDAEFEETAVKAAPLLRLLDTAFPERQSAAPAH